MKPAFADQPEYKLFRNAYAEKKAPLVVICGSGLSAPAGLPSWNGLRRKLQAEADAKERSLNQIGHKILAPKVEAARSQSNPWVAFKLLKEMLTKPVFDQLIETYLTPDEKAALPESYKDLTRLELRGLVTLNLDKFAGEALDRYEGKERVTPVFGKELAQKWNQLRASKTYLVYLHGGIHDPSTWVLTQDDLNEVVALEGHRHFLQTVFTEHIVLFVGVSADDVALSRRLLELTGAGFRPKGLYWLTSRLDAEAEQWAEAAYVSLIRYQAKNDADHATAIADLVADCIGHISQDEPQAPLIGSSENLGLVSVDIERDPENLAQQKPEDIRRTIATLLDERLTASQGTEQNLAEYRQFCNEYDYAVHRAFYRGQQLQYRKWFGYDLDIPSLGRGNFGEVYSAKSPTGDLVAVKVMHESIFGNDDMLGGFRRGVRSMDIVTRHKIPGMVPLIQSFELPPTIIMPYVEGLSLQDALSVRSDLPWLTKLEIAKQIGVIVSSGHALPQTVLHRDLKPSNIMIRNFEYAGAFDPDIVVLDFDMSWHKGSKEKDVVFESRDDFGYLAPEQTDPLNRYAARSTRVDSYGYGMTIFYLFGHDAPRPNEALSDLWEKRAIKAARRDYSASWKSAPIRLGRLIVRATQIDQSMRVDFASMVHELDYLKAAVCEPDKLDNAELWAEEVLCQLAPEMGYDWNDGLGSGYFETVAGVRVSSSSDFRNSSITLEFFYADRGMREKGGLSKYLNTAATSVEHLLQKAGWLVRERRVSGHETFIQIEIEVSKLRSDRAELVAAAMEAMKSFQM